MFTKAEEALIKELREQKAPLERWAKFFPQHKIVDLMEKPKPLYYYNGEPVYKYDPSHFYPSVSVANPCSELPCNPEDYARSMKKGNIYKWDNMQDAFLIERYWQGYAVPDIILEIRKRFGIERTVGAIYTRLRHLGLQTTPWY